jgi:glucosylceramidase
MHQAEPRHVARTKTLIILTFLLGLLSCRQTNPKQYSLNAYETSQAGNKLKRISEEKRTIPSENTSKIAIELFPEKQFQEYIGFGASFTESSAWNLATIPVSSRKEVLTRLFSPSKGAGFSLTRTHINSSDYSNGHYTYVDEGDESLESFSIYEDLKGFSGTENEQVEGIELITPGYDMIPMILEASNIPEADFKIIASPWSPPSWMKSGETSTMTNGSLMPQYYGLWARYLSKYVSAYKAKGIDLWGLTPQNEPLHAHDARWDSNGFSPIQGRDFLRDHLGPQLVKDGHINLDNLEDGLRVLIYDHNKSDLIDYVTPTYEDPEASKYAWGTGFHWYASSGLEENNWHKEELETHRKKWPHKGMIHTESSIDIDEKDPIGQYWRESIDYAGTFVPFDTYVNDIIADLNSGTQGYIEWCMILSHKGQPNPYDNFNSAPVLINPETDEVTYTPLYYLLSHFSKFIRPGSKRIETMGNKLNGIIYTAARNIDDSIVLVIFNGLDEAYEISISIDSESYKSVIAARSLQTLVLEKSQDHKP